MTALSKGLSDFIAEAMEILDALGKDVVLLDDCRGQEADPEVINRIFRGAHSLKGLSGLFGLDRIAQLAHQGEELLDRLRLGKVALTDAVVDALAEAIDVFIELVTQVARNEDMNAWPARAGKLAEKLEQLSGGGEGAFGEELLDQIDLGPETRAVLTEYEEHRLRESIRRGRSLWRVRATFPVTDFDEGLTKMVAQLKALGEVISTLPSPAPAGVDAIAFDLVVGTEAAEGELAAVVKDFPAALVPIPRREVSAPPKLAAVPPPAESDQAGKGAPPRAEAEVSLRSLSQTVRVDIRRLDMLMNTVGELLLIKGNLARLAEAARGGGPGAPDKPWRQELLRESRGLERRLDELQKGLLEARMVPLGQVFDKLARLVRRNAREAGKEIDFLISGGEVELDKLIVEELSDPLMHILRNAIDHGVETPEARVKAGKPRRAQVSLRARQKGNHVVIEVGDDGAGIDVDRVREVALLRGVIGSQEAAELDEREICNLIFLPGFSTARNVSALSGRGVGLDVVKTNIAHLSGLIDVESERGLGTVFHLTLPVTLAIIRALVVGVSGRTYAVPLNSVLEITTVRAQDIRTVERREVMALRGQTLPYAHLSRLFGHRAMGGARHFVVVVGLAQERLGLAVDELFGQQDIVIKPLGGRLRHVRGISGATDLGNRRTVLVVDVGALMEDVFSPERHLEAL